jgi:hypothetical protein
MNDFDRVLELRLRHLLDPVVASQPPVRRGRLSKRTPILTVITGGDEFAREAIMVVEPVGAIVPVAAARMI